MSQMGRDEEIRRMAYEMWEREGRPDGRALDHWQRAEKKWTSQHGGAPQSAKPPEPRAPPVASPIRK